MHIIRHDFFTEGINHRLIQDIHTIEIIETILFHGKMRGIKQVNAMKTNSFFECFNGLLGGSVRQKEISSCGQNGVVLQ